MRTAALAPGRSRSAADRLPRARKSVADERGKINLPKRLHDEIQSVAKARQEPMTQMIERAWRVFVAFEGDLISVPLDQRPQNAALNQ